MKLAVHDLITHTQDQTPEAAFRETGKLVQEIEKLGYHRYCFAEHHGFPEHLSSAPEILAAYFAAQTSTLRVGVAGIMLMHYPALKIAEQFKTLAALAPGRIDLGLGRAPGAGLNESLALREGRRDLVPDFEAYLYDKYEDIMAFLQDQTPKTKLYTYAKASPYPIADLPKVWMLGSTGATASFAAQHGLPYSFAKFFSVPTPVEIFRAYKRDFIPGAFAGKPELSFSYRVVVAESQAEADYLAKPMEYVRVRRGRNDPGFILDPETVKDVVFTEAEQAKLASAYDRRFIIKGDKESVRRILEEEIATYGLDELMFYIPLYDPQARLENYKILAELFG